MSAHKLDRVKHAIQVLRLSAKMDHGPLVIAEVEALEAMAVSQARLISALEGLIAELAAIGEQTNAPDSWALTAAREEIAKARGTP